MFLLAIMLTGSFALANNVEPNVSSKKEKTEMVSYISCDVVDVLINTGLDDQSGTVPCRWRTVYHHANGDVSYTEWTYGNCNRTESGKLIPIR